MSAAACLLILILLPWFVTTAPMFMSATTDNLLLESYRQLQAVTGHQVATIGGRGHAPSGISKVQWTWKNDEENSTQFLVEKTLYFPQSPINIISVTEFYKQLGRPGRYRN